VRNAGASVAGALLAAVANDPKLLEPIREHYRRWLPELDPTGRSFADRAAVWLAGEGLWLLELFDLSPLNQRQRRQIAARLLQLAEGKELAPNSPRGRSRALRRRKQERARDS